MVSYLCHSSSNIILFVLTSAKCDYPILNNNNSQIVQVMGYVDPSLEGTTINFSCPTGQILAGPRSSTCLGNGEWEMESNIRCIGEQAIYMPIRKCL